MKWPWQRGPRKDRLVVAQSEDSFVFVQAEGNRIVRCGAEARGSDDAAAFARRVRALGLPGEDVIAVLSLADCQLLQIEAPAVPPEELKAAARWKIKDMVESHLGDLTLDVMQVGDGRQKASRQLFVAVASSRRVRELSEWSQSARLQLAVIDIREAAQRNLQCARAAALGRRDRATAALMVHANQCLLTLCAQDELFYARRLDWKPQWLDAGALTALPVLSDRPMSDFADLDIVDYGADDVSGMSEQRDVPPIVIELQRSLDLWDRTWPELSLDSLAVHANGHTGALVDLLKPQLALPVEPFDVGGLFPGLDAAASNEIASSVAPLLGALLRQETRQL